jgi:hypothetical protein
MDYETFSHNNITHILYIGYRGIICVATYGHSPSSTQEHIATCCCTLCSASACMQCTNNGQKATLYLPLIMVDNAFLLRTGHLFPFYITVGCASAVQQWDFAEIQLACAELNWLQWNRERVALDPPSLILKKKAEQQVLAWPSRSQN